MTSTGAVSSVFAPHLFTGRVALISGGGTGIGLRTAREFMHLGGSVIIVSRKADVIAAAVQTLNDAYPAAAGFKPRCAGCSCNIREAASIATLMDWIAAQGLIGGRIDAAEPSRVDYLVNNAGGQFPSLAADMTTKGWSAVIETNLTGTFQMSQAVYRRFFSQQPPSGVPGGAAIVSVVANMHNGFPLMSHTGAARAGVVNLTKSLAVEWAASGVRVNAIAPGVIASSGLSRYDAGMRAAIAENAAGNIYAARLGTEAECAAAILFLLSPASAFTSGACLNLDGAESLYSTLVRPTPHSLCPPWDDADGEANKPEFLRSNKPTAATTTIISKL
jgi:NAD(P)-dependent dehydrogenase (short-subunit alcohol dehydrogenase family)